MSSRTDWTSTGKTWAFKDESSQPIIYQVSSTCLYYGSWSWKQVHRLEAFQDIEEEEE